MNKIKEKLIGILMILMVLIVGLVLSEVYFAIFNPQYKTFLEPDPVIGTRHIPNLDFKQNDSCIKTFLHFNNEGMNDTDHTIQKPEGVYRIAVLGDSYVEAMQFDRKETFFSQLEENLKKEGKNVEILSFGVGGFGTAQEYLMLKNYAEKYSPDLIILSFFSANDVRNNSFRLEQNSDMPYASLNENGEIVFSDFKISPEYLKKYNSGLRTFVFDNFQTARYLYRFSSKSMALRNLMAKFNLHTEKTGSKYSSDNYSIYFKNSEDMSSDWKDAWKLTEALILETKKESEKNGSDFILFSLSNPEQIYPDKFKAIEETHPDIELSKSAPEERLNSFAEKNGIRYISALGPMENLESSGTAAHAECHGHWTKEAHHLAGKILSDYVANNILSN